jgi:hypothetical protein
MTNEQQQSPIFCLDKLKKHLYNTIWGIKQLLTESWDKTRSLFGILEGDISIFRKVIIWKILR